MLGALDTPPNVKQAQILSSKHQHKSHRHNSPPQQNDVIVMNMAQQHHSHRPPHHHDHDPTTLTHVTSYPDKSSTDVEVTPLPSDIDDDSVREREHERPLTVSQLNASKGQGQGQPTGYIEKTSVSVSCSNRQNLSGALNELESLSSQQKSSSKAKRENKENIPNQHQNHQAMGRGMPFLYNPSQQNTNNEPFGRVMGVLSQINANLQGGGAGRGGVAADRDISQPGYFSRPPHAQQQQNTASTIPRMPLIQPDSGFVNSQLFGGMHQFQVPERDTPHLPPAGPGSAQPPPPQGNQASSIPFPLLTLTPHDRQQIHNAQYGAGSAPRLIPPEELIAYEQTKYAKKKINARQVKNLLDQYKVEQERARLLMPGSRLLRADFEPFAEKDERDKEVR